MAVRLISGLALYVALVDANTTTAFYPVPTVDCSYNWSAWGECSSSCPSFKSRFRVNVTEKAPSGLSCTTAEISQRNCRRYSICPKPKPGFRPIAGFTNFTNLYLQGVASNTIPSVLAAFAAVACALLF